ncbi:MAG: HupE/UreJ family protein [Luteolibacter sp.]
MLTKFFRIFACLLLFAGALPLASAHQVASVELEFKDLGKQWQLQGTMDIAAMMPETRDVLGGLPMSREAVMKSPPQELARVRKETEARLRQLIRLTFADKDIPWRIEFPEFKSEPLVLPENSSDVALVTCTLIADAVPGAGELSAHWSDGQMTDLIILTQSADESQILSALPGGSLVLLKQTAPGKPVAKPLPATAGWVQSGFHHVMGPDHVLFILGLFLLVPGWRALMSQSLLFTLAHSISLALAVFGVVKVPGNWVEHLIALTIAWVGIENLLTRKLGKQRLILVFCFGLLHGLGFASVLAEKVRGISGRQLAAPLLEFNLGVELAQIAILLAAFLILRPLKKYTVQIQTIGSAFIAIVGISWAIQRFFFPGSPLF